MYTIFRNKPGEIGQHTGGHTKNARPQPASTCVQDQVHANEDAKHFTESHDNGIGVYVLWTVGSNVEYH